MEPIANTEQYHLFNLKDIYVKHIKIQHKDSLYVKLIIYKYIKHLDKNAEVKSKILLKEVK
jgi:hypothetical protein